MTMLFFVELTDLRQSAKAWKDNN